MPTLNSRVIVRDVAKIKQDNGHVLKVFSDFQAIGKDLVSEATLVLRRRLPTSKAILASRQIDTDLARLAIDKQITIALINWAKIRTNKITNTGLLPTTTTLAGPSASGLSSKVSRPSLNDYGNYFNSQMASIDAGSVWSSINQNGAEQI